MSDHERLVKIEPSGLCVGTLEQCGKPEAAFLPVTGFNLDRAAAAHGVDTRGPFTLRYAVPTDGALAIEGEPNAHRVAGTRGERRAEASLMVVDARESARPDGRLDVEIAQGEGSASWSVAVWAGEPGAIQAHASAMLVVPLVVAGWLALAGFQQVVAPRRSAQTTGAFATAGLTMVGAARTVAMQHGWSTWWADAPRLARLVEIASIPALSFLGALFYHWLVGRALLARALRAFYAAAAASLAFVLLAQRVPAWRGAALSVAQLVALWAGLASVHAVAGAWRGLRSDERRLIALGVGSLAGSSLVDILLARAGRPLVFGSGIAPFGLCVETLCQALILSRRDARAHAEVTRLATVAREASERELAEQARVNAELQRLDKLKDEFLANTSHELRTPLNGVVGLAESLLAAPEELPPRAAQGLRTILASGRRLDRLVSDLLDFSRAEEGALAMELVGVDLAVAASEALVLLAPSVGQKDLRLTCQVPNALPLARADETRLAQALQHVIGNAIKFTERGEVRCSGRREAQRLVLAVEDTGPGFPPALLDGGIAAFAQGDGSSTRAHGGTGLGLAFAKRLMELQGGALRIANRAEGGARVELELPVAPPGQQRALRAPVAVVTSIAPRSRRSAPPGRQPGLAGVSIPPAAGVPRDAALRIVPAPRGAGAGGAATRLLRVLVADDEPVNLERIELDLEGSGCDLVLVDNGAAAVEAFDAQGPFDLVLLDVMMPKLDGLGACRALRERAAMTEVPIVMVTAKREPKDLEAGFEAGANDYLTKPYVRQELLQRVKAHASVARMTRSMQRYVPQPFATLLGRKHLAEIELGDSAERELAVLFLDVRGFTEAAERMTSRQVFSWLNEQFGAIVPALHAHGGLVDKYLGDAVMALFPRGARSALEGAVAASRALRAIPDGAHVGMGIHFGVTMLGALGEASRMAPTVVSDTVNVAARLEALTRRFEAAALVSGEALDAAGPTSLRTRYLGAFRVKGRSKALRVHEVLEAAPEEVIAARLRSGVHVAAVLGHLEARRFAEALGAAERGFDAHPDDAVLAFYVAAMDAICSAGAPFDGAMDLGEK